MVAELPGYDHSTYRYLPRDCRNPKDHNYRDIMGAVACRTAWETEMWIREQVARDLQRDCRDAERYRFDLTPAGLIVTVRR